MTVGCHRRTRFLLLCSPFPLSAWVRSGKVLDEHQVALESIPLLENHRLLVE